MIDGRYPVKPLGELVDFLDHRRRPIKESERRPGPFPYYGANGQQGTIDSFIFDEPLVLLAEDGGHFDNPARGIAYRISGKCWVNNHAHVLKAKNGVDLVYLCRALENYDVRSYVTGTTRGKLTQAAAAKIPVLLPPLNVQRWIADILDAADELRSKRRAALHLLDTLTQSTFFQMFGDWSRPGNTRLFKLGDRLDFLTSGSRGWAKHYSERGSLFLRIQNVQKDELTLEDVAFVVPPATLEANRTRVMAGDVLLSITADLGRTAVVPEGIGEAFINQHLSILRTQKVVPRFLSAALSSPAGQRSIAAKNREGVKAGLNFDDIRSLEIPDIEVAAQKRFADLAVKVDALKVHHRKGLDLSNTLFVTLKHRTFRGEL